MFESRLRHLYTEKIFASFVPLREIILSIKSRITLTYFFSSFALLTASRKGYSFIGLSSL
jgi:hypothetical protein